MCGFAKIKLDKHLLMQDVARKIMDIKTYFILYINVYFFCFFFFGINIETHAIHKQPTIKHNFTFEP